ncbi:transglutaminaseTgpA domain-containing protein [Wohlfahrtiimonas larvae]|uniref:Protein-glutamine gamma-glutamyltransferase TgpA n=1 Tax=Wohlfahrtiimonas larvae TaxID=1157986 RepID=A0ABP9MKJ6_9GAMM|nr:DUF3488 and transglutaminase-like domain-containing protein [Wohlfahrtiimonas larvae]
MTRVQNISQRDLTRGSILWFSIAFILTIIPQLFIFLPIWVAVIFAICLVWRIQIFRMKINYPNGVVKFIIIAAILCMLFVTKGNFLNTEGCTILFMAIYGLKFVEAKTVRDGYILGCIGLIALTSTYLFENSAYLFIFSLITLTTLVAAMIGLQQLGYSFYSKKILLWNAIKIMGLSLPLMAILFIIFPRFPSMLPNMNKNNENHMQAQTGVSNRMEPGSIAELANSETHILWAEFSSFIPKPQNLYWRSLTLDYFDGRAWQQTQSSEILSQPRYKVKNRIGEQRYSVIFDPSHQKYLATLDVSVMDSNSSLQRNSIVSYSDFRFEYNQPIEKKIQYSATYLPNVQLLSRNIGIANYDNMQMFLQYSNNNPKTQALVEEMLIDNPSKALFVTRLLQYFKQDGFQYTLQPGVLQQENSIDQFMFDTKLGFCEHYASATAFMLRKANIPSRIVIGYLGGAINRDRNLVEVRGKDAHAWVEYWDEKEGWIRVDPTMAVSPDRIDLGIDELIGELTGMNNISTWDRLSSSFSALKDRIDYSWTKMILNYQSESQQSLLKELFKIDFVSVFTLIKISLSLIFSFVLVQVIIFFKPWQRLFFNIGDEYFRMVHLANKAYGLNLPKSIAPIELSESLMKYLSAKDQEKVQNMAQVLVCYWYQPNLNECSLKDVKYSMYAVQKLLKEKNVNR